MLHCYYQALHSVTHSFKPSQTMLSTQNSLMTIMFAIDFLEKSKKISNISSNNLITRNMNMYHFNNKGKTINNSPSIIQVNSRNRSLHFIGQPQWRGYSH